MSLERDIAAVQAQLQSLPPGHPDVGHLATLLVGLQAEKMGQDKTPMKPLFDAGDALLSIAPHNVLATLLTGSARPRIIHSLAERGPRPYVREYGL
jgi:hypothetical protein